MQTRIEFGTRGSVYPSVLSLRSDTSGHIRFDFDHYSYHYVLVSDDDNDVIGGLTAQRASDGIIDCETFYPAVLRRLYQPSVFSTCKLRIRPGASSAMAGLRLLVRDLWQHQTSMGRTICVINVVAKMKRFYQRIGFTELAGFEFCHPVLATRSHVMVMTADPTRPSFCRDIFEALDEPVCHRDVVNACCQTMQQRRAA